MSEHSNQEQSVELLQQLGLKEYEARCFVALCRLPSGTAKQISEISEVPRTRIYDAIRVLEAKGLVEVQHASPKRFRAVSVEEAVKTLRQDFANRTDHLLEELQALETATLEEDSAITHEVWALSGSTAIDNRTEELVADADDEIVVVIGHRRAFTPELVDGLQSRLDDGVAVIVGTLDEAIKDTVETELPEAEIFVSGLEWLDDASRVPAADDDVVISRLLMVDRRAILVSTLHDDGRGAPGEEMAIFGTGLTNGLVVVARRLMATGLDVTADPGHTD